MPLALVNLLRNLSAGVRLALFGRVGITSFRVSLVALLALLGFLYAFQIALDYVRVGPDVTFNPHALPVSVLGTATTLLVIAFLAGMFRQPGLMLALAVTVLSAAPLLMIAAHAYFVLMERNVVAAKYASWVAWGLWAVITLWATVIFARAVSLSLSPRPRHFGLAIVSSAALMLGLGMFIGLRFPVPDWWIAARAPQQERADAWNVVTEQALVRQPQLLDAALHALKPQRPGTVDLYFVGFASYAGQDVFRKDLFAARTAVGERFDVEGRTVELLSNPATVLDAPIASVSNLRRTLAAVGARIDRDEDVVMLFLTSHGGKDHRLAVEFFPLRLDSLAPEQLNAMLDEAGIRWRIVVVSACYSGGYIPALANERTLVMTAAAADRMSFGCSHDSDMTFFTNALFNQAMRSEASLLRAFERARTLVSDRERAEALTPPSDPQIWVGVAMREKLDAIEARARTACAGAGC